MSRVLVLQYVHKHGRITRREAAELCRLSPYQASRVLQMMTDRGQLTSRGKMKGTYYELSD